MTVTELSFSDPASSSALLQPTAFDFLDLADEGAQGTEPSTSSSKAKQQGKARVGDATAASGRGNWKEARIMDGVGWPAAMDRMRRVRVT